MSTYETAQKFVELIRNGEMERIYADYYQPDVLSVEADGEAFHGMEGITKKNAWWDSTFEMHSMDVEGPYPHGDSFALKFGMDITERKSGQRSQMSEIAVYKLRDGRVAEERFFYVPD